MDIISHIAKELSVRPNQIAAAVNLLDDGSTVPFIARYRKEATDGLDDQQLRVMEERLIYLRELEERRGAVISSIESQGKLSPDLKTAINAAESKTILEDLYLPFKPKRRTKAQIAREAGLESLANALLENRDLIPEKAAEEYISPDKGISGSLDALDGARQILMERFAEDAALAGQLRDKVYNEGILFSTVAKGKEQEGAKFRDYFDYAEMISKIPSHRALALFRGRKENILQLVLKISKDEEIGNAYCQNRIAKHFDVMDQGRNADNWLKETVRLAWKVKLFTRIDLDLKQQLRETAEEEAIKVFSNNLRDLLLAAPAGSHVTMGLDPGLRTGVKVAVVDKTGKLLDTTTIYPHPPQKQWDQAIADLSKLVKKHNITLVSIGNGTGSRETDQLVGELIKRYPESPLMKIMVSEAGASVYSASILAANEFPDLDVSLRGAVSIARRLQDPLAELVKIEPKAIGVGQYQHDVNQSKLNRGLNNVVEDCVNAVGVDVNTASPALLKQVSGLTETLSQNIVDYRDANGSFSDREQLRKIPRLGDKTFQQAAGFLRIIKGKNPLDSSAVHPEAYPVVEKIIHKTNKSIGDLIGQPGFLRALAANDYTDDQFGLPTVTDILSELEKPGRDPRPEFKSAKFKKGVEKINDLTEGMRLEGVVTNVTNFGAFVDIGVHQDGLVHISQLADNFVKDPREVVKAGAMVKVTVVEIDIPRKRIGLTMKSQVEAGEGSSNQGKKHDKPVRQKSAKEKTQVNPQGAMASAFARALKK